MESKEKIVGSNGLLYFWQKMKGAFVSKESGKGLSSNDFTTAEKTKLSGMETGANKTVVEDVLTSVSSKNALSAKQGSVLDTKIKELNDSLTNLGYGDMLKTTYDTNRNGIVDDAEKLGGQLPSYYAKKTDLDSKVNAVAGMGLSSNDFTDGEKEKLSGIAENANCYVHPSYKAEENGFYKVTIDEKGHVSKTMAVKKEDITALGVPAQDTTYGVVSASANGLMASGDKVKLDGISKNANVNVIESISVNGSNQSTVDKNVNIVVPTKVTDLSDAGLYAKKTDLASLYEYKGSVDTFAKLPLSPEVSDVYNVVADETTGKSNVNYAWNGTSWDDLGGTYQVDYITNAEIDAIVAL